MYGQSKPLSPADAKRAKISQIPDVVYDAVNHFLTMRIGQLPFIHIKQQELIDEIQARDESITREMLLKNNWLDFEDAYNAIGWKVVFVTPGYDENYSARFEFSEAKKSS